MNNSALLRRAQVLVAYRTLHLEPKPLFRCPPRANSLAPRQLQLTYLGDDGDIVNSSIVVVTDNCLRF
jgi:hypothetical protein